MPGLSIIFGWEYVETYTGRGARTFLYRAPYRAWVWALLSIRTKMPGHLTGHQRTHTHNFLTTEWTKKELLNFK